MCVLLLFFIFITILDELVQFGMINIVYDVQV